jgi:hypothetical protein
MRCIISSLLGPGLILVCGLGSAGAAAGSPDLEPAGDGTWSWTPPRLAVSHARLASGRRLLRDEDLGWWRSGGTEVTLEAGLRLRRGGLQGGLQWRGALGEHLTARGRLLAAYLGWRGAHWSLRAGRIPVQWGPAGGALLLSRQAVALDQIALGTSGWRLPLAGGRLGASTLLGYLDDGDRTVPYPLLWGMEASYVPCEWLILGARRTILFGGAGRTQRLTAGDLWRIFWGQGEGSSAPAPGPDAFPARESDQKFAWHATLHPTAWSRRCLGIADLEAFYTYAGEDRFQGLVPMAPARAFGMRLHPSPRFALAGLRAKTVVERNIWYHHKIFLDGYTYRGVALGHPMGGDARAWRFGCWLLPAPDLLLGLRVDREERGYEKPERVAPGGFWRWNLESTAVVGSHRVVVSLEGSTPWGADRESERLAEALVSLELHWGAGPLPKAIGREEVWGATGESR